MWPDNETVRKDILDYALEVESFDRQVGELIAALEDANELANTLVIVTSDNGMPFPRSKGHNYDISNHLPLVVSWPAGIKNPGRSIDPFISFIDFAPTVLDLMKVDPASTGMHPITGQSFTDLLLDQPTRERKFAIIGRERNDVKARPGTPAGLGYPVRGIRESHYLYLINYEADRWPCGDPDLNLLDTDASPTKSFINDLGQTDRYWQLCFGKRPAEELFDLEKDPDCLNNLAEQPDHKATVARLRAMLTESLQQQGDPRVLGQGKIFDEYLSPRALEKKKGSGLKSSD